MGDPVYIISTPDRVEHRAETVAEYRKLFTALRGRWPGQPLKVRSERRRVALQTATKNAGAA